MREVRRTNGVRRVAVGVVLLAGGFAAGWIARPESVPVRTSASPDDGAALAEQLAGLREEWREAASRIDAALTAGERREPAAADDPQTVPLVKLHARLDEVARELKELAGRLPLQHNARRLPVPETPKNTAAVTSLVATYRDDAERAESRHICWTPRAVYARYGKPDSVLTSGQTIQWHYRSDNDRSIQFDFADGVVVDVRTGSW